MVAVLVMLPLVAVPAVLGVMLGSRLGASLLRRAPAALVRRLVIGALMLAGLRALTLGLGLWT